MKQIVFLLALFFVCVAGNEWILRELKVPRVRSAAAQVGNKLYIAGGEIEGGSLTDSIEVLNTDYYEFEAADISLPSPRQQFTAIPIGSKIYFSGGSENNIDVFDTSSNSWTVLTIPGLQSDNITFAGSLEGYLVYVGGAGEALFINVESSQVTTSLQICPMPSLSASTRSFLQMPEYNGNLYAACFGDIVSFNASHTQKLPSRTEPSAVVNHMLVTSSSKPLLIIADITANQFYFFTLQISKWDARLLSGRRINYAIAKVGAEVHIMGGSSGPSQNGTYVDFTFGFDFNTESSSLSRQIALKVPRSQMTPFSTSNAALFIGGITGSGEYMGTIDIIYEGELKMPVAPTSSPQSSSPTASQTSGSSTFALNFITVIAAIASILA